MPSRPNIVLFLTDDHGAWANGCYGNREVRSPNLDHLAQNGARFEHAYTPSPVCSPARACLLTGKTPSQVGIHDWLEERDPSIANLDWLDNTKTLFRYLSDVGYRTGLSGKWHLGQSHQKPDGADYHFGLPHWQGTHNDPYTYVKNGEFIELEGNKSSHITDHAIEFLQSTGEETPFFLCVGYIATHSPYEQQAHDPRRTAMYQESQFTDIPEYKPHPWVKNEGASAHPIGEELRDRYIGYYASVTEVDDNVGHVLMSLEECGYSENTIVIYTSDHGCALGHHGIFGKGNSTRPLNMYETSLQVPLIWSGVGIKSTVVPHYVDHYDTFQTLCDVAGVSLNDEEQFAGQSYLPMLKGEDMMWDNTCYGEYGDLRMIRNQRWKLVYRYPDGPHDLFDLQNDPHETKNIVDEHPLMVKELKRKLEAFYRHHENDDVSGLRVKDLPIHNTANEAWRDGRREARGLQVY